MELPLMYYIYTYTALYIQELLYSYILYLIFYIQWCLEEVANAARLWKIEVQLFH